LTACPFATGSVPVAETIVAVGLAPTVEIDPDTLVDALRIVPSSTEFAVVGSDASNAVAHDPIFATVAAISTEIVFAVRRL
jgi:hypothetical protein